MEVLPNGSEGNGAKRYTYNTAGYLTQVETHNGSGWDMQAEMAYNGLGQRLSMDAAGVIAYYVMDGNRPLIAESNGNTTSYLYGLGVIGEETNAWSYSLTDGTNTQRQLTDALGEVTYSARYTPWSDTLESYGSGNFAFGYFGGLMDAATGLLYVGDGQYYDPSTGRFLTRNARPNSPNPYLPFDPTGALFVPLALVSLVYGRKRRKSKWDILVIVALLGLSAGMGVAACGGSGTPTLPAGSTVTAVVTPISSNTAAVAATVNSTPVPTFTATVPPNTSVEEVLEDLCVNIPTPEPVPTYDKLNERLLEDFPRSPSTTNKSGADYYKWYQHLWENEDGSFSWWWKDHDTFTIWDFITLVLYLELHSVGNPSNPTMYAGFPSYKEAIVRVVYQDCKSRGCAGGSPEATLNWLAGYSESGARICCTGTPRLKDNPYGSAEILVNSIRYPESCGASEWVHGWRPNRPYGVGNKNLYDSRIVDVADELQMISWRSNKKDPKEVIIPTGCGSYVLTCDKKNYEYQQCGGDGKWPRKLEQLNCK